MKEEEIMNKSMGIAEKRVKELYDSEDLKKLDEKESINISNFYLEKSLNRLETAKIVHKISQNNSSYNIKNYNDYSESVSASYYAMYYIVHSYIAKIYKTKLREGIRGVHAITNHLVLYYLVKTKKLAKHLYEEYKNTLDTIKDIQNLSIEDFQREAYDIVKQYDKTRSNREIFTYRVTSNIEERKSHQTLHVAEEFINTIRQMM